ncbi:MAG: glycosyltransferase [Chloroflexota bacterium]
MGSVHPLSKLYDIPERQADTARQAQDVEAVSIVIPSWTGNVARLLASIETQAFRDYRVRVVQGVSPAGKARNIGVAETRGDLILFVDDDAYLAHDQVLGALVGTLRADPTIGVVGPSMLIPPDANVFQRRLAAETPRWEFPVQDQDLESNPPLNRYGHTAITTTCCLLRRSSFESLHGFDEAMVTGEDTEFFFRMRRAGYRFIVPRDCWIHHNPPRNLRAVLKKYFGYGVGHAAEARKAPDRHLDMLPLNTWYGKVFMLLTPFMSLPSLFVSLYFEPVRRLKFGLRPLKGISSYAALYGYAWGWLQAESRFLPQREPLHASTPIRKQN